MSRYHRTGFTVWFNTDPRSLKTNPFDVVSDFGTPLAIGRGNMMDEANLYREALDAIMDMLMDGPAFEVAKAAIADIDDAFVP